MNRILKIILICISIFFTALIAIAAPTYRIERTILPETNQAYELGTSTKQWLNIFTKNASTTDISIGAKVYDSTGSAGTNGKVLQTTGSATQWVATSTLGISSSPGGSDTQVQFNDSGIFGGDSNFIWDKLNDRLGIQVSAPQVPLHVSAVTNSTLTDVTVGSATLTAESLPSAPSVVITKIGMPSAGSGGSGISYIDGGAGTAIGSANGTVYYFRIYPVLSVGGIYYKSTNFESFSQSDPNDAQSYNISVGWGTVTISGETVEYFMEYSTDDISYAPLGVFSGSGTTITSLSGSDPTAAWPTFYTNTGVAPTPFDSGSAGGTNVGGGGLTEVTGLVYLEVDSVTNIAGTNYVSGTPTGGSFDDSGYGSYDAEISWNDPGGSQTNAIVRISQDGGVTWYYQYVGASTGPYTFTSLSNDATAEARWGQTFAGSGTLYAFVPYGRGTSPSGGIVYSTAGSGYNTTVTDSNYYIFKHVITGLSGSAKIVDSGLTAGRIVTATPFYDTGYNAWGDGPTVTPNSYGFTGTNQNRDYKIYSYDSTLGIYAVTPLTVSTVLGSGSKYVALAWTLPTGVTRVKITRQVNGGGYNEGKILTSASSYDDDSIATWTDGTTVTPTSILKGTARFDKALTTLTNEPHLALVDITGSGTRYSKISFGVAADSSSSPTYQSHIYSVSNTGYLSAVSGRLNIEATQGATPMVILGNTNSFNNGQSSSIHFNVKGANDANLINTRSDRDTVGFGQAIGTDNSTTVQIQPARSTDMGLALIGHASMATTFEIFKTLTSAGSLGGAITVGGDFRAGAGTALLPSLSFRADTNTGFYNVSGDVIGLSLGGTEKQRINATGNYFGGAVAATDLVHLGAGTTAVAPLRFTTGSLTTGGNIRTGQMQFLTDKLHFTITTGTAVKEIALNDIALTSGRLALTTTNGRLTDLSTITHSAGVITATGFTGALNGTLGATTPAAAIMTSLQADSITNDTGLAAGVWTPTRSAEANLDAVATMFEGQYSRVGNTVTFSGRFSADPTLTATATSFEMTLPVASNIGAVEDLGGGAFCGSVAGQGAQISGSVANNTMVVNWVSTDITNQPCSFWGTYQVI